MRRLYSKEEEGKRRKKNQILASLLLVGLLFLSVLGYAFQLIIQNQTNSGNQATTLNYKGFTFTQQNNFWILSLNGKSFVFKNSPYDVQKVNSKIDPIEKYKNKTLYIYSENAAAEGEIRANLVQTAKEIVNACPKDLHVILRRIFP